MMQKSTEIQLRKFMRIFQIELFKSEGLGIPCSGSSHHLGWWHIAQYGTIVMQPCVEGLCWLYDWQSYWAMMFCNKWVICVSRLVDNLPSDALAVESVAVCCLLVALLLILFHLWLCA